MTVKIEDTKGAKIHLPDIDMMPLQDIAEMICDYALKRACAPDTRATNSLALEELFKDATFQERFRVGLAHGAVNVLAAYDQHILSAYLFADTAIPRDELKAPALSDVAMRLLVLVSARSAALDALAAALDQALIREVRELPLALTGKVETILNPTIVTEKDVQQRKGFGVLFSSAYAPPLTIWKRDEGVTIESGPLK